MDGNKFIETSDINVEISAEDKDGIIDNVELLLDNRSVGVLSQKPFIWNADIYSLLQDFVPGFYTLKAIATDDFGESTSASIRIEILNNILPKVSFTSPTDGQTFMEGVNLNVQATATDEDGTIASVQLFLNDQLVGTDVSVPYAWGTSFSLLRNLQPGNYVLKLIARDDFGETTTTTITITVSNNALPVVNFVKPVVNQSFTEPATIDVEVSATDSDGVIGSVELFLGSQSLGVDVSSPYTWAGLPQLRSLKRGIYTLEAVARDNFGESGRKTLIVNVQDNMSITFLTPVDGAMFKEGEDLNVGVDILNTTGTVSSVELFLNNQSVGTDFLAPYRWSEQNILKDLAAGDYFLKALATDNLQDTSSRTIKVIVKPNALPTITFQTPTNGQKLEEGSDLSIMVQAADTDGTVRQVEMFFNEQSLGVDALEPYKWENLPVLQDLRPGNYMLKAVATDDFGKVGSTTINIQVIANLPPVITFTRPADGITIDAGSSVTVDANITDSDGQVVGAKLFVNGQLAGEDNTTPYSWSNLPQLNNLTAGIYQLRIEATDNDDAIGEKAITISVKNTDGSPVVTIIKPTNGQKFAQGEDIDVFVEAKDFDGVIRNVRLYLDDVFIGRLSAAPYEWKAVDYPDLRNLQSGMRKVRAIGLDSQGKTTEVANNIEVLPNTPPVVFFVNPVDQDIFILGDNLDVEVDATDAEGNVSSVELFFDGTLVSRDSTPPFTWTAASFPILRNLQSGNHTLRALAKDSEGGQDEESIKILVSGPGGNFFPTVSFNGLTEGQKFKEGTNLTVNATATDTDGTIAGVQLFYDNELVRNDAVSPYQWNSQLDPLLKGLKPGNHTLKLIATDNEGGIATSELTIMVTPNVPPIVSFVRPTTQETIFEGTDLIVEAAASDSDGTVVKIELFLDGTLVGADLLAPYRWDTSLYPALDNITAGVHTLQLTVMDDNGASNSTLLTINVIESNGFPIVNIIAPVNNQMFPEGANLLVQAKAADADGTIRNVRLFFDGVTIQTLTSEPYEWNSLTYPQLADLQIGTHTVRVVAVDNQGKSGESTHTISVIAGGQNVPPMADFVSPTNLQNILQSTTLLVQANATDADGTISGVQLFYDATLVSNDAVAPYSWTINNPTLGNHTLRIVATDNGGAKAEKTITIVIIQGSGGTTNTPPTVSITAPTNGQSLTAGANLTVNATASDANGTVSKVALFYDGVLVSEDNTSPYSWTINSLVAGSHVLRAVATDNQGATAETTVNITVTGGTANTPPTVTITNPANGASFQAGTNLLVQANASDANGSVANVALYYDNQLVSTDAAAPYSWTILSVVAGTHTLRAVATDNQGATAETTITITVQGTTTGDGKPVVTITTPQNDATFGIGADLTVKADVIDTDGTIKNARLVFDGATVRTITTPPFEWNATTDPVLADLTEGTHEVKVVAVDNQNKTGEKIHTIKVASLSARFVTPLPNEAFAAGSTVVVLVDATDSNGSIAGVDLYMNGTFLRKETGLPYEWGKANQNDPSLKGMAVGTYQLRAVATDNDGNTVSVETTFRVTPLTILNRSDVTHPDEPREQEYEEAQLEDGGKDEGFTLSLLNNIPPSVTINTPSNGQSFTVGTNLTVRATATDSDGTIRNCRLYFDGNFVRKIDQAPFEWNATTDPVLANLQAGEHTVRVGTVDDANVSTEVTHTITVGGSGGGGTTNTPPTISLTSPSNGQTFTAGSSLTINANASDANGSVANVKFYYDGALISTDVSAPYSASVSNLAAGAHTVRAVATDNQGASAETTVSITVNSSTGGGGGNGAVIQLENMTKMPFVGTSFPADDLYAFCNSKGSVPTMTGLHNTNTMRIHNRGNGNLVISSLQLSNPAQYRFPNDDQSKLPISVAPGSFYDLVIEFHEINGGRGIRNGSIQINSNAGNLPVAGAELRGAFHVRPEGNNEPLIETIIDIYGFKTKLGSIINQTSAYPNPQDVTNGLHGNLVLAEVWEQADKTKPVVGFNLATYKGGAQTNDGSGLNTRFIATNDFRRVGNFSFNTCAGWHQSILAKEQGCIQLNEIGGLSRDVIGSSFRIAMDGYTTDGKGDKDPVTGRRALLGVRLYKVIDRNGVEIPNHYIAINDYVKDGCFVGDGDFANCDWNDNVVYFINIRPVNPIAIGGQALPDPSSTAAIAATPAVTDELTVYPNPASNQIEVDFRDFSNEAVSVIIQDHLGRAVLRRTFDKSHTDIEQIDLSSLAGGFYILNVQVADKQFSKKIVVSRQ